MAALLSVLGTAHVMAQLLEYGIGSISNGTCPDSDDDIAWLCPVRSETGCSIHIRDTVCISMRPRPADT